LRHESLALPFKAHYALYSAFIPQHIIGEKPSTAFGLSAYSRRLADSHFHKKETSWLEIGRGLLQKSPMEIHTVCASGQRQAWLETSNLRLKRHPIDF
jgi:hypothetical protein